MENALAWTLIVAAWLLAMVLLGILVEIVAPWAKRQIADWRDCRRVLKASGLPRPYGLMMGADGRIRVQLGPRRDQIAEESDIPPQYRYRGSPISRLRPPWRQ